MRKNSSIVKDVKRKIKYIYTHKYIASRKNYKTEKKKRVDTRQASRFLDDALRYP